MTRAANLLSPAPELSLKMPDGESPPKFGNPGFKLPKDLSLDSKMDLRDAMVDKKHESQTTPKHQSIAFDPELINSPLSKYKLQSAFDHKNSEYFPKAAFEKEIWVSKRVRELQEAFSKCRKAESSISGCIESSDRWSAKEGTAQDLRYTLVSVSVRHSDASTVDDLSSCKSWRGMVHLH